ncbi:hypothetical protein M5Y63_10575, partial [Neisseria meningitidis]|nr:hypothetical protein [Neisseria meningitidis]MCL4999485.1 hypothetical protein [Neisseria meningitidis]MCL5865501.1 hypothetical protein [Neisseria meningitidis]MCL6139041.1 hypothetical protein [Neisseria meningitidis]
LIALPDKAGLPPYCLSSHLLSCHRLLSPRFYRFCQLRGFGGGFDGFGGIGVFPYPPVNGFAYGILSILNFPIAVNS